VHREAIVSLWVALSPLVEIAGHYLRAGGRNSLKAAKRTKVPVRYAKQLYCMETGPLVSVTLAEFAGCP
jgi:hypothetical protein